LKERLDENIHFRISTWSKIKCMEYKIDIPTLCRRVIVSKIREMMNDPVLKVDEGGSGPDAPFVQAWQRIMPCVTQTLTRNDYIGLKESKQKLHDFRMIITSPLMSGIELQNLGIFLQGELTSERILDACIEAHLQEDL